MSHEVVKMFAVGTKTWHGLETLLDTPPITVDEVLHYSGMGLKVEKIPAKVFINGVLERIPDLYAVVREDGKVVGHAGEKWRAFQDRQFVELMHSYVDAGLGDWETGGVLSEGSRVFGLIKLKGIDSEIVKDDKVYPYILGTNGHTTGISTAMMPTVTRVVCRNTLRIAEREGKQAKIRFTVRHSQLTKQRVEEMKKEVDAIALAFLETSKVYKAMSSVQLDSLAAKKYFTKAFGKNSEDIDAVKEYFASKQGERLLELFETGRGVDIQGVRGTLWGAYNAVTEYLTHDAGRTFSSRFESGNFGLNATINAKALNLAQEMMVA